MSWKTEWKKLTLIAAVFLACFYLPVGTDRFDSAMMEGLHLTKSYAREHVMPCLILAFFIAGAIAIFVSQNAVMRYLGPKANKVLAYGVASVSGTVLAICSCTILPLFAGIYRMGAGIGPATAFLYSGPAINVLAIVLTARVLGVELGIARAVGAIVFSIVIGLLMHLIFRREELGRAEVMAEMPGPEKPRALWKNVLLFASMVGILIFSHRGMSAPDEQLQQAGLFVDWTLTIASAIGLAVMLVLWLGVKWWLMALASTPVVVLSVLFPDEPRLIFAVAAIGLAAVLSVSGGEAGQWLESSWLLAKQMLPLLFAGVLVAGALLGRPDHEGIIPSRWVADLVGGNSVRANFVASVVGALMYFATLTEVPILQGLIGSGMGKGPALALLLAGPALSLPNMLVIRSIMGTRKTLVFILLVVVMATVSGIIFGVIVD
ncbi:MAG: permease [Phycisphaerales bacterium]|nr:MAG: permease [Phycisphaerales bacterium]